MLTEEQCKMVDVLFQKHAPVWHDRNPEVCRKIADELLAASAAPAEGRDAVDERAADLQKDLWDLVDLSRKWEKAYLDSATLYADLDHPKNEVEIQIKHIVNRQARAALESQLAARESAEPVAWMVEWEPPATGREKPTWVAVFINERDAIDRAKSVQFDARVTPLYAHPPAAAASERYSWAVNGMVHDPEGSWALAGAIVADKDAGT